MKTFLHEKYARRIEVYRVAIKLLGWKVALGFWFGPSRHFLIRHYPNWAVQDHRGIQIDLSRLTFATSKDIV